jgi:hypothetical protein
MGEVVTVAMRFSGFHLTDYDCSGEAAVDATSNLDSQRRCGERERWGGRDTQLHSSLSQPRFWIASG